eukprot:1135205-Prorocentrum_minimum.AAC.4
MFENPGVGTPQTDAAHRFVATMKHKSSSLLDSTCFGATKGDCRCSNTANNGHGNTCKLASRGLHADTSNRIGRHSTVQLWQKS